MAKIKYYKELDGIRGLAAIMIILFHFFKEYPYSFVANHLVFKYVKFGQTGVTLFFVLSGFLITRILIESKTSSQYFKFFFIRRALRIFPLYYLVLVIIYSVLPFFSILPYSSFSTSWYFWFYVQNIPINFNWPVSGPNHFWSLAVEEHFYLIWPFVIFFCQGKKLIKAISFTLLFSLFVRAVFLYLGYGTFYFTLTTMDALAIGGFLAIQERKLYPIKSVTFYSSLLILLFVTNILLGYELGDKESQLYQFIKYPLLALLYYCLLAFIILSPDNNLFKKIFRFLFFKVSGRLSYGLYVYHPLIYLIYFKYVHINLAADFLFCISSSYIIAYISYELFEKKILTLKKYFGHEIKPL